MSVVYPIGSGRFRCGNGASGQARYGFHSIYKFPPIVTLIPSDCEALCQAEANVSLFPWTSTCWSGEGGKFRCVILGLSICKPGP